MRIESSGTTEHIGSVKIYATRRMLELDSGSEITTSARGVPQSQKISEEALHSIEQRLAIVLPCKNEDLKVFEGVLAGIPHDCLMIIISASDRHDIDNFRREHDVATLFCQDTQRQAIMVHQRDSLIARALGECGYSQILDETGLIRNGKSEGMVLGIIMAMLSGREYVGFIDTDNYIPGAVLEYVKHYALGFNILKSPYSMVRIQWRYKPKLSGELYFKRWGRVSEITNRYMNRCISESSSFETEIIKTANAGEHAMSIELAKRLTYGSGYGVETQELVSILERFGAISSPPDREAAEKGVEILQTETINPHLHKEKGEEHLTKEMLLPSLSVIYHSPLSSKDLKEKIIKELRYHGCITSRQSPPQIPVMPEPATLDLDRFRSLLDKHLAVYTVPSGMILSEKTTGFEPPEKPGMPYRVVFTDLDGTLLHPVSYSYAPALDALRLLQESKIPLVFCSAKTRSEQIHYRDELGINDPFIVENGGAIFIPRGYFRFPFAYDREYEEYLVIEIGMPFREVYMRLAKARADSGMEMPGFFDMSLEEVARTTNLSLKGAEMARQREYSETLVLGDDPRHINRAIYALRGAGLDVVFGGRFHEVSVGNDKGKCVKILSELYKLNFGDIHTIGIGDNENDRPMLQAVNEPYLVLKGNNRWAGLKIAGLKKTRAVGPEGWAKIISWLVTRPNTG